MNPVQLQQLESLCTKLYIFQDPNERIQAEKALTAFGTQPEYLLQAKFLLDNAQSAYAQHFATSSITKILTKYWNNFAATLRLEIRNHMLTYLASNAPKLQGFVVTQIIQLICRITKLGWFDEGQQDIYEETTKFLKHGSQYYLIGLRLLNQLLSEMNEVTTLAGQSWSEHRKTCNSFRDKIMLQIFKLSLTSLVELYNNPNSEDQLRDQALELAFRCLNFDFLGTSPDDSTDDLGSVQAPSSWKPLFEDDSTVKLFLQIYLNSSPPRSTQAMQCLVQVASIRSLFNEAERDKFLGFLIEASREILQHPKGLSEQANHHEFCRFLARLKGNFQASSIVASKNYAEWIQSVAMFTMNSFNHWQWSPNSVFFLLTFWSRLVMSIYYIKNKDASMIETLAPQIVQAFLTARLEAIASKSGDDEGIDEDEEQLLDQLEAIPHLGRCKYEVARNYIVGLFDPLAQNFRKFAEMAPQSINAKEFAILQGQLALLVYTMGGIIGGRQNIVHTTEEHDQIDAELASRILELMRLHDTRLAMTRESSGKVKLELAFAEFLEFFRKAYLSDQASNSSKLYPRLQELIGITDPKMLLNIVVTKIATNLKYWVKNEKIIYKTLFELNELAGGYASSKILVKLDITAQLLTYHTSNYFPFLDYEGNVKYRTIYYLALSRLLFVEDNFPKFDSFIEPLKQTFTVLRDQTAPEVYRTDNCKKVLRGLFRDILGIIFACASRRSYLLIFDFIYPDFTSVFLRCADLLYDCSEVMNPMLKFFSEFVYSKGTRISFDTSSVNGILLFREASKLLSAYGARIINFNPTSELYNEKYKGIMHSMTLFHRALTGNYVNFGIFALYGDSAFSDALSAALKMSLSIPMQDMLSFPKLTKVFFALFETLTDKHMSAVARLDSQSFRQLVIAVKEGIDAYEVSTSSQSCAIIERIVSFRFTTGKGIDQTAIGLITQHLNENTDLFNSILTLLFQRALDNCQNLWSVSRPTMCLIMLSPDHFMNLKNQLLARQPPDRQQQLAKDFDELMKEVRNNLETSNRDKFSQNFNSFVSDVKKYVVL